MWRWAMMAVVAVALGGCDLYFGSATPPAATPPTADAAPQQPALFQAPIVYGAFAPTAVAVSDLDGDGWPDLIAAGQGEVDVLRGTGGGAFGDARVMPDRGCPLGATVVGKQLAIADCAGAMEVVDPDGLAASSDIAIAGYPTAIASGDFDGDGIGDLAVASYFASGSAVTVLLGYGSGGLSAPAHYDGAELDALAIADVDGDGRLDVVTATSAAAGAPGTLNVLLGRGDGTFGRQASFPVGFAPEAVALADLNGDGWLDAATANPNGDGVSVVFGRGDGSFGPPTNYPFGSTSDIAIADVNGDGHPDLVVAYNGDNFTVMFNAGDGTFPTTGSYPCGACGRIAIGDVDADGAPDVIGISVDIIEMGVISQPDGHISVTRHAP